MNSRISGIGMTSQRTRMRMVERLRDQGVKDEVVLGAMMDVKIGRASCRERV